LPRRELERIEGLRLRTDLPIWPYTTFKIGGTAGLWVEPYSVEALERGLRVLESRLPSYRVLGCGSNLLVDDAGIPAVLCLSGLCRIEMDETHLTVGAGTAFWRLMKFCMEQGIGGLEPLCGIPASVGGACFMNAGANGVQFLDLVDSILLTTSQGSQWFSPEQLQAGYRDGGIPDGAVVSACRLAIGRTNGKRRQGLFRLSPRQVRSRIRLFMKKRVATQPITMPSAGCIFRNPDGDSAGRLLDLSGLKGRRIGQAAISEKHANFIVNQGGAGFGDVLELMELAASEVERLFGVRLRPEVTIWRREQDQR